MEKGIEFGFLQLFLTDNIYLIPDSLSIENSYVNELELKYFGQNKHKIAIIVNYKNSDFLKTSDFDFLLKIMKAVNLMLHELSIVNLSENKEVSFDQIKAKLSFDKLILFDVSFSTLLNENISRNLYTPFDYKNINVLMVENLTKIQSDVHKKRKLWTCLQNMF